MTEESRVSRTPRTWTAKSDEPPQDVLLRDDDGDLVGCGALGRWRYLEVRGQRTATSDADGCPWSDFDDEFDVRWPLVEVLPDAPEPQPERRKIAPMWREEPCDECGCDACDCDEPRVEA